MAEAILFHIAESLLKKLGSRALDEIALTQGFKTRLTKLEKTINTIKTVLSNAEERQVESDTVREWHDRLKTALYAADDLFDEFATVASQREVTGEVHTFFSRSNHIAFAFHISKKIKKIREELDDIVKDGSEFGFVLRPREEGWFNRPLRDQTHSFVNAEDVIGRDDDKEVIINTLMTSCAAQQQRLSVIPIVGIGGLGKTTLAQLVYNDKRVERHFELKLWVSVSEVFDIKEITKKILMSATDTEPQNLEMDQLQGQLRKEIRGKNYLLVLDDVWNEHRDEWLKLDAILKVGGEGSKILVTTRSKKVADIMGTMPTYDLEGLSEDMSWALFENMAFEPGEAQKKPQLVKLGKAIVKKCAAVPLALITLGSLLYGNDEWKWISVAGTTLAESSDKGNSVMAILKLSYFHLLSPLKNCFAYCALFPKDYVFLKETLINHWMAEGFVVPAIENQSLNELGDEYILLLLQRCFFQNVTRDKWGNISSFKMHDLMHDLAQEVAGTEYKMAKFLDKNFSDRNRHLSVDYHLTQSWVIPSSMLKAKQLRTFILTGKQLQAESDFNKAAVQQLTSNFRRLRTLDMCMLGVTTLPESIGKLIHLRYLNLSTNPIKELPNSISKLQNLQTFILSHCTMLKALPSHTHKLTDLRSLNVFGCRSLTHMPPSLGTLTSLHKLPLFLVNFASPGSIWNPTTSKLRDLNTLNNLRGSLEIKFLGDSDDPISEAKEANINSKHGLTELRIEFGRGAAKYGSTHDESILDGLKPHQNLKKLEIFWYRDQKLPHWVMTDRLCLTLPNLVEIHLCRFETCRQLPCFSHLPFLRSLSLEHLQRVEYMERSQHELRSPPPLTETFFPSLQKLTLLGMFRLRGWWEEVEEIDHIGLEEKHHQPSELSFSTLEILEIEDCMDLRYFPLCPNVEKLVLNNVNKLALLKKLTNFRVSSDVGSSENIFQHGSKLKTLSVDKVEDLISLPEECLGNITSLEIKDPMFLNTSKLNEVFKRLASLRSLKFADCYRLESISEGLEHLISLSSLSIQNCAWLDLSENERVKDGMPWKALNKLRSLDFDKVGKLNRLPNGIQHLTNLRSLRISRNFGMVALPEWISCFSSLQYVELYDCFSLACLPREFGKLTTLNELKIVKCSNLTDRCRGPTGADWNKIQHIPLLTVKYS